ncbi:hypothetical protein HU200_055594 [Digitaria exilis]|uniref:Uncharacterized protein n=1 Tax=Digitaria exilis TaxID=1010633 RepID=A0A835ASL8_9POAL|nr:hypothetical protein HU200_055594 [Digitaria exilis]
MDRLQVTGYQAQAPPGHSSNSLSAWQLRRQPPQHRPRPQQCAASNSALEEEERGVYSKREREREDNAVHLSWPPEEFPSPPWPACPRSMERARRRRSPLLPSPSSPRFPPAAGSLPPLAGGDLLRPVRPLDLLSSPTTSTSHHRLVTRQVSVSRARLPLPTSSRSDAAAASVLTWTPARGAANLAVGVVVNTASPAAAPPCNAMQRLRIPRVTGPATLGGCPGSGHVFPKITITATQRWWLGLVPVARTGAGRARAGRQDSKAAVVCHAGQERRLGRRLTTPATVSNARGAAPVGGCWAIRAAPARLEHFSPSPPPQPPFRKFFLLRFYSASPSPPPPRRGTGIMPSKWQVWGQPDGSLVWVPASDAPPTPPPAANAAAGPHDPAPPRPPPPDGAPIEETLGPDGADGRRLPSMADLLLQGTRLLSVHALARVHQSLCVPAASGV